MAYQSILNQSSMTISATDLLFDGLLSDKLVNCNSASHLASGTTLSPLRFLNGNLDVDTAALFAGITTDNIAEGKTNLYYTDTRARSAISYSGNNSFN